MQDKGGVVLLTSPTDGNGSRLCKENLHPNPNAPCINPGGKMKVDSQQRSIGSILHSVGKPNEMKNTCKSSHSTARGENPVFATPTGITRTSITSSGNVRIPGQIVDPLLVVC
ncbi:uncharacterized protein LOC108216380 isoform X2 [Daucus carota subsp. sativus]|uniref:uncharacterized protein LOC108216380 isoform X2 n=1 Tax=Daucus carota subsp. sativus TaxID=79200 RepID=UPI0007F0026A|nr:PREDICTED: uncharacterized protein LOC108216380 [Daucus carota subsp. sativus]